MSLVASASIRVWYSLSVSFFPCLPTSPASTTASLAQRLADFHGIQVIAGALDLVGSRFGFDDGFFGGFFFGFVRRPRLLPRLPLPLDGTLAVTFSFRSVVSRSLRPFRSFASMSCSRDSGSTGSRPRLRNTWGRSARRCVSAGSRADPRRSGR